MTKSTLEIANEMEQAKTFVELKRIIENNNIGEQTFGDRLLELCAKYEMKPSVLQKNVAVSKSQFYAGINGKRNLSKENIIKIALALGASVEEINELLKLSKHKELYVKNREDAIILFGIKNRKDIYEINELLKEYNPQINLLDKE